MYSKLLSFEKCGILMKTFEESQSTSSPGSHLVGGGGSPCPGLKKNVPLFPGQQKLFCQFFQINREDYALLSANN